MKRLIKKVTAAIAIMFVLCPLLIGQTTNQEQQRRAHLLRLARNLERNAQFARSLEIYERLWNEGKSNLNYYRGVKRNLIRLNRLNAAEEVVNEMIEINSSIIIRVDLGDIFYKQGEEEKAFKFWNDLIKENPKNQSVYQIVASSMRNNMLYAEAIEIFRQGQKALNNENMFLIDMANIYRAKADYLSAVKYYLKYLEFQPKQYSFVETNITSFVTDADHSDDIIDFLKKKIEQRKNDLQLRNILAAIYIRSSNYQAALEEFSTIDQYITTRSKREKNKLGRELFGFAQNAFNDGAYSYSIQAYELIIKRYPDSNYLPQCHFGIALALEEMERYSEAITKYRVILTDYKNPSMKKKCYYQIGLIQLEKFLNFDEAERSFLNVLEISPEDNITFEALFKIGDCYVMRKKLDEARKWYEKILNRQSVDHHFVMRAVYQIGRVYYWKGNFEEALKRFEKIQADPINITNDKEGIYVNDALDMSLFIAEHKNTEQVLSKYSQADFLKHIKEYDASLKLFRELISKPETEKIGDAVWLNIGEIHNQLGQHQQAIEAFQNVVNNFPHSVHKDYAQKMIGEVYQQGIKDTTQAIKAYELVLTKYPHSIFLEEVRGLIRQLESEFE